MRLNKAPMYLKHHRSPKEDCRIFIIGLGERQILKVSRNYYSRNSQIYFHSKACNCADSRNWLNGSIAINFACYILDTEEVIA